MSTVPRVVAEWMVSHLPSRQLENVHAVDCLSMRGLDFLTVKELKILGEILYSMAAVVEEVSISERRLPSSAKKQRRIDFLRRGLFIDNSCTIINDRLLQAMRSETRESSSTIPAAASSLVARRDNNVSGSAESTSDSRKRPNNQISQPSQPRQQQRQQPNGLSADDFSALFNAYYASQFDPPIGRVHSRGQNIWPGMPMNATDFFEAPNGRQTGNDSGASGTGGSSSTDGATVDPQSTPQNPTEASLLQQLLEMGFQKQEILDGIRQCRSNTNTVPSADEVMLHLVSQREEAEEARKEDEVRLLSENQKKDESRRREQNQKDSLQEATTGEDLMAIFPESWVLNVILAKPANSKTNNRSVSIILGSNSRNDFVEFLKLEEKSRKWYGWVLPAEYFRRVGRRLKSAGDKEQVSSWATFLSSEREKLRSGLYELKEQLKGQPKIFLGEKPKEKGVAAEIVIIDDD